MKNLKPFNLKEALFGKAVMLRNGRKAYVRHHETELDVDKSHKILGYLVGGSYLAWCEDGVYYAMGADSDLDIIGMYPETRIINGFEVPEPEKKAPKYGTTYYLATRTMRHFHSSENWDGGSIDKLWLERGLVFLNKEDATANAKAVLGIDPNNEDET
jgi:hypothetical protein